MSVSKEEQVFNAASQGDVEILRELLRDDLTIDVNWQNTGRTDSLLHRLPQRPPRHC